jgi:hypothetical protein
MSRAVQQVNPATGEIMSVASTAGVVARRLR